MELSNGPTRIRRGEKFYAVCPECGEEMSPHALLCRDCFKIAGGVAAPIYRAASERGEASSRSIPKPEGATSREYTINPAQKR